MSKDRVISDTTVERPATITLPESHDRINEAYYGKLGEKFKQETRTRIHWICDMVQGSSVLDVGCSQGITSTLLSRAGKTVTGVDSDPQAIADARTYLKEEPLPVQRNIDFVTEDFLTHNFSDQRFDTIVMTEVLEHIVHPEKFIAKAAALLSPDARLIVTVPFGINDFVDHKHTYYLLEPYQLISGYFEIIDIKVFGKWIGFVGHRKAAVKKTRLPQKIDFQHVSKLEGAFRDLERTFLDEIKAVQDRLSSANIKYRRSTGQVADLKLRLAEAEAEGEKREQSSLLLDKKITETEQRSEERSSRYQKEIARLKDEGEAIRTMALEFETAFNSQVAELAVLKEQRVEADNHFRLLAVQVEALRAELAREGEARNSAEEILATTQEKLETLQDQFSVERKEFQREIAHLSEVGQARAEEVRLADSKVMRLEAELLRLIERLDEADHSNRLATEQLADAIARLSEQEDVRTLLEETLEQAQLRLSETERALAEERTRSERKIHRLTKSLQARENESLKTREKLQKSESALALAHREQQSGSAQLQSLQQRFIEEEARSQTAESELKQALSEANARYRLLTGQEIPLLKQKLHTQSQRYQEKIDHIVRDADHQVAKTRDTLSFRLGYILLHCFKSFENFSRLPKDLWQLRREAVRRRHRVRHKDLLHNQPVLSKASITAVKTSVSEPSPAGAQASVPDLPHSVVPSPVLDKNLKELRIACIMDEFTYGSYAPECQLTQLTPAHWQTELEACEPELLFIESAWRGKDELWGNKVGHNSHELQEIVGWCRQRKVPTVFWNKEDPIHFETFLTTAKQFDYVFTTDIDCIHRYKALLGHERVYLLPFACQPEIHNPIENYERKDAFCFAGAYYSRYPDRIRDLESFAEELPAFRPLEIYDRNFGKDNPDYMFPQSYQPFIVGTLPFEEIDKAYKGYRYAINLNSVKQSQTMFARRVFELLASNTITVSNFSRGIRLLFGDLVVTSDSGAEQVRRLKKLTGNDVLARKLRLAALRKVLQEHTYGQRLTYVASKVSGQPVAETLPRIAVLAKARSRNELTGIEENFTRQEYRNTTLHVVVGKGVSSSLRTADKRIVYLNLTDGDKRTIGELVERSEFVCGMVAGDYYGPHYLLDMALATRYSNARMLGKGGYFSQHDGELLLNNEQLIYQPVRQLNARSAMIRADLVAECEISRWLFSLPGAVLEAEPGQSLDEFNYCRKTLLKDKKTVAAQVNDLPSLNCGISIEELLKRAELIGPEKSPVDECVTLSGKLFAESFPESSNQAIRLHVDGERWIATSTLADGSHEYLYASKLYSPEALDFKKEIRLYFDVTPGLNIQLVIFFLDAQKQKISHVIRHPNRNQEADIPPGTVWLRFGMRFYSGGSAEIKGLVLGHRNLQPAELIGQAEHLLLTNHYPEYENLYRNGFVHTRVRAYQDHGCKVDVFRLRSNETVSYHEFENVDVISGSQSVLHQMLSTGQYKSLLVHFLDSEMWEVLQHHVDHIKVNVWVHGAEIQPWTRRAFNFQTEQELRAAKVKSKQRVSFWKTILKESPANLKLVFVSQYLADTVMEDFGINLPEEKYTVIHNAIDTDLFSYSEKPTNQRAKILSIRPYASRVYANDLSVQTILSLSKKAWFSDLDFRIIGDGRLFNETLAPLRKFKNVHIEQCFLTQSEIAGLHREYGIFLCPTRMDSQGVSRDEAMASGLVPVTNAITAIPEFVDQDCGILAPEEDFEFMASGIAMLYENPDLFARMSKAAAIRVRKQSASHLMTQRELELFAE